MKTSKNLPKCEIGDFGFLPDLIHITRKTSASIEKLKT